MTTSATGSLETLERSLDEERRRFDIAGMAVAVIRDGTMEMARGFGRRDEEGGLPATERTLFAIGSATKAFTAGLVAALVGDGLLSWGRPVREYLPRFALLDPVATALMTPRDLLCHRSGLPRHDLVWYANPDLSRREVVEERLRHLEPNRTFREVWQYNNLMYMTAGHLAGEVMGTSWEEGVRRRLLEPLGMDGTRFSPAEARATDDWSRGYRDRDGRREEMAAKDFPVCGPAGSIYSSVADLARWLEVNLNQGRRGEEELIAASALLELQKPAMVIAEEATLWPEKFGIGYGLGWFLESYRGHRIIHHGGNIDGFSAMVMMVPEARAGAAVLTNGNGTMLPGAAAYRVIDELLGLDPLPWGERFRGFEQALRQGGKEAAARRDAAAKSAPAAHGVEAYAGEYHDPGYGSVHITLESGSLRARYGVFEPEAAHRHFETWDLRLPSLMDTPIPLTFATDAEGEVTSLSVPFEASVAPIVFRRLPAADLARPERLAAFAGDYVMGPVRARARVGASGLTVELVGMQTFSLEPVAGTTFSVKGQPALRVEFAMSGDSVREMVVQPGVGVFTPAPPEAEGGLSPS
ncbi:MAG TPA: serine hydrolase [Candidatus Dormibacteraeota bacterium]|nr:serine hydrolase [Candidatus Dormibacteraeota bacterium]